jgi:N-acetylmuramoyl-L-alanine amidase
MSTWILVPGHGGISPGGIYLTRGKRSPQVPPGIYEGEFNRAICDHVAGLCFTEDIDCVNAIPGPMNPTLKQRVAYCNSVHAKLKNCVVICVHANAAGKIGQWNKAQGTVVFHSPDSDQRSKDLAKKLSAKMATYCEGLKSRGVKTARFAMVQKVNCSSVLLECGFMDNLEEATYLASYEGQIEIADAIFSAIKEMNE